jgi:regulator of PEP synthase PpsR (kinase-PPPase family)
MEINLMQNNPLPIYVVSGGKGLAGDAVLQSILIQFPNHNIPVVMVPDITTCEKVNEVVERVLETGGVIVHTMVVPGIRAMLVKECNERNVKHFDLVGDISDYISAMINMQPVSIPGLFRLSNMEYFQRIEAIEFTLAHDDGQNADKISKADIILTGVSRAGKTPLSIYLAMFGWKVANVPLVNGLEPPKQLFEVDSKRVFGLSITINSLITQREKRVRQYASRDDSAFNTYVEPRQVRDELDYAESVFRKGGFTIIDVTNKPIESTANEISLFITQRFDTDNWRKKTI